MFKYKIGDKIRGKNWHKQVYYTITQLPDMLEGKTGYGFQYINNNREFISMSELYIDFEKTTEFYDYLINCDLIKTLLGVI